MNIAMEITVITAIVLVTVTIITYNMLPIIENTETMLKIEEAKKILEKVDTLVTRVAYEGEGSKRTLNIDLKGNRLIVSPEERSMKILIPSSRVHKQGFIKKEGKIKISSGAYVHAYKSDIDNDGIEDLVLENPNIVFAIKNLNTSINLSNIITKIKNKKTNEEFYPQLEFYIENVNVSSGNGYTILTQEGDYLLSSSIKVVINATYNYELLFTLGAGDEFISVKSIIR